MSDSTLIQAEVSPTLTQPQAMKVPTNVLVVGVGGQGVIMVSKVLAALCQQQMRDHPAVKAPIRACHIMANLLRQR